MIQKLKEQAWFKATAMLLAALAALTLWQWLAGAIFLARFGRNIAHATPVTLYSYWHYYGSEATIRRWVAIAACIAGVLLVAVAMKLYRPKKQSLYGDSKLAKRTDLEKAGLLGDDGILIGKFENLYLRIGGNRHVMLKAPTGEGKGVAVVMPNALAWKQSMIAFDLKDELRKLSSGFRAQFQLVFSFNPLSETYQTHRYNPLSYLPEDPNLRINEIQKIANFFLPDRPGTDPIWTATPRSLFTGIALMLRETPGKLVTIGQVRRESLADGDGSEHFKRIIKEREEAGNPLSPECVMSLNVYTSIAADVTRAGIIGAFRAALDLWANPLVDAATSANDFDLRMLRKKPMTIYIPVSQDNLTRVTPLLRIFYQQVLDLNTRQELHATEDLKYSCLLIQDERAAIGQIPALDKGIAYLRSYGFSILSVFQSIGQVNELLGRDGANSYTANHAVQIVYPPSADETEEAEHISRALGEFTLKVKAPNGKGGYTVSEKPRRLMLPREVVDLDPKQAIIMKRGMPPAIVKKIEYYSDRNFKKRLLPPVVIPTLDMAAHNQIVAAASARAPRPPVILAKPDEIVRAIAPEDIPNLHNLALKDFVLDFSTARAPVSDTLDFAALDAYAEMRCKEAGLTVEVANG